MAYSLECTVNDTHPCSKDKQKWWESHQPCTTTSHDPLCLLCFFYSSRWI